MKRSRSLTTRAMIVLLLAATPAWAAARKHKKARRPKLTSDQLLAAGERRLDAGNYDAALADLGKAARRGGGARAYFLIGWTHYQRGFRAGTVEAADRGDARAAIEAYREALRLDPKLRDLSDPSRLRFSLALCEEAVGSYDRALKDYREALRLAPGRPLIALNAARLRLKMKAPEKAAADVALALTQARRSGQEQALRTAAGQPLFAPLMADAGARRALAGEAAPALALAAQARGEALRDVPLSPARPTPAQDADVLARVARGDLEFRYHRYQDALSFYNQALALDGRRKTLTRLQQASLREKIGAAQNKLGLSDAAIASLRASLEKDPSSPSAHYELALAYGSAGRNQEALEALRKCFGNAADAADLRLYMLLSKTDAELEGARALPGYRKTLRVVSRLASRTAR